MARISKRPEDGKDPFAARNFAEGPRQDQYYRSGESKGRERGTIELKFDRNFRYQQGRLSAEISIFVWHEHTSRRLSPFRCTLCASTAAGAIILLRARDGTFFYANRLQTRIRRGLNFRGELSRVAPRAEAAATSGDYVGSPDERTCNVYRKRRQATRLFPRGIRGV